MCDRSMRENANDVFGQANSLYLENSVRITQLQADVKTTNNLIEFYSMKLS
jgi:hypothetical protein